jgi:carboxyl-terminal processing protease
MGKFKALKITLIVVSILVIFTSGFWLGFGFNNKFSINIPNVDRILLNKNNSSASSEQDQANESWNANIKSIEQSINLVLKNALNSKSKNELIQAAIKGVLASLDDEYADFFTKEQYEQIMQSYQGIMSGGIGIIVTTNKNNMIEVVKIIQNSPASNFDIKQGDLIKKVDDIDVTGLAIEEVVAKIKGPVGTKVKIVFFRPSENKNFEYTIERGTFIVPNFIAEMVNGNIAYIQYYDFQEGGTEQLDKEIENLINQGAKGLILDLRNNLGGVLDDAVNFCDLFLENGTIVTIKGRTDGQDIVKEYKAKAGKYTDIPIVLIINGYSASASEIAAGALQDNKRALLVGEKSFGKGTVQALYILPDGSGIKFTTAKYYLPSGISIDGKGVKPDINVILTIDDTEDVQKNRAIEEMKKLIR